MSTVASVLHAPSDQQRPRIIAHRGLSSKYPENTIASYQAAIKAGAELVELDFYSTADDVLICVHDPKLDRYLAPEAPNGLLGRPIRSFNFAEIRSADVGSWKGAEFKGACIPTLEEALCLVVPDTVAAGRQQLPILLIEHKEGTPGQLLALLRRYEASERVIVQSFHWDFLRDLHARAPEVPLAVLGSRPLGGQVIQEILEIGAAVAHWHERELTMTNVWLLHQAGLKVWAYTLNSEIAYRGAREMALDGVTTDCCDKALAFYATSSRRSG